MCSNIRAIRTGAMRIKSPASKDITGMVKPIGGTSQSLPIKAIKRGGSLRGIK